MNPSQRILHPAWRDEYQATTYPFGDWATLSGSTGVFIPEGTFLDASLYPVGGGERLRLSKAVVSQQEIVLYVGDTATEELCSTTIDLLNPVDELGLTDKYGRPAGLLVSTAERLAIFQTWPPGTHKFTFAQTGFCSYVHIPVSEDYFLGFQLEDGSIVSGDIWLVGGAGVVLSYEEDEVARTDCDIENNIQSTETRIRVDVVGDPLFRQRLCTNGSATPKFIKQITFKRGCGSTVVRPDERGMVYVTSGRPDGQSTVLRVRSSDNSLKIGAVGQVING
jgi:hypothetical protein